MTTDVLPSLPGAIIFDFDGTLVDSWDSTREYYNLLRREFGLPCLSPAEEEYGFVHTIRQTMAHIFPERLLDQVWRRHDEMDFSQVMALMKPQPGIVELLTWLTGQGVVLGINTNSGHGVHQSISDVGLDGFFRAVACADDVARGKPHPEGVIRLLHDLETTTGDCVFVGDSAVDGLTAQAAGLTFWAYAAPDLKADHHFADWDEMLAFLKGLSD